MKVGDIVVLIEDHTFIKTPLWRPYKKGQKFKIIGNSGIRGWDLESIDTGEKIYETFFSSNAYVSLSDIRAEKLKELGI
jgi:hypothetical protein